MLWMAIAGVQMTGVGKALGYIGNAPRFQHQSPIIHRNERQGRRAANAPVGATAVLKNLFFRRRTIVDFIATGSERGLGFTR
jgi:hypothetical protein